MPRALVFLVASAALTLLGRARAEAATTPICEVPPSPEDISPRLDEDRPAPVVPSPPVRDLCLPGTYDDASCWPQTPIPEHGGGFFFGSSESYTPVRGSHLPTRFAETFRFTRLLVPPLASGHARRLERPPRVS